MIDCKDNYNYLGSYISYFENDFYVSKGMYGQHIINYIKF